MSVAEVLVCFFYVVTDVAQSKSLSGIELLVYTGAAITAPFSCSGLSHRE